MLKKINNKWLLNFRPSGISGKQIKKYFNTKTDALQFEAWAKEKYRNPKEWENNKKDNRSLKEIINLWYEVHGKNLNVGKKTYQSLLNVCNSLGNPKVINLKAEDYLKYRASINIKDNSKNRELAYLKAVLNYLINNNLLNVDNPLSKVKNIKIQENELCYLDKDEIKTLLDTLKKSKSENVLLISKICLSTGARWSEAENLTLNQLQGNKIVFARTKSGKVRSVDISEQLKNEIINHSKGNNKIFTGCYKAFLRALNKSGIILPDGQASHILRHSFASHYLANGGEILQLKNLLGHQSITTTMRYSHLVNNNLDATNKNPLAKWDDCGKL